MTFAMGSLILKERIERVQRRLYSGEPQLLQVSPGELFDRLTIAELKAERIQDESKRQAAQKQLSDLQRLIYEGEPFTLVKLQELIDELREVNGNLWETEDELRALDSQVHPILPVVLFEGERSPKQEEAQNRLVKYAKLARMVYVLNDRRSEIKAKIDQRCGHQGEVKEYSEYQA